MASSTSAPLGRGSRSRSPRVHRHLVVAPAKPLGARVSGLNLGSLRGPLKHDVADELRAILHEHGCLILREQEGAVVTPEALVSLAGAFSSHEALWDPGRTPHFADVSQGGVPDFPMVRALGTKDGVLCRLGYEWHVDSSDFTALCCLQAPASGGETLFVSSYHLYDSLSDRQRCLADSLQVRYSSRYTGGGPAVVDFEHGLRMNATGTRVARPAATRKPNFQVNESPPLPAVQWRDGRAGLIFSPKNVDHCVGFSREESLTLVEEMMLSGLQPQAESKVDDDLVPSSFTVFCENVYVHSWEPGDVVLWDNHAVLHSTTPVALYNGDRKMLQVQFSSDAGESFGKMMNARAHDSQTS